MILNGTLTIFSGVKEHHVVLSNVYNLVGRLFEEFMVGEHRFLFDLTTLMLVLLENNK